MTFLFFGMRPNHKRVNKHVFYFFSRHVLKIESCDFQMPTPRRKCFGSLWRIFLLFISQPNDVNSFKVRERLEH